MFRVVVYSLFCIVFTMNLRAQQSPGDSAVKIVNLQTVIVCELSEDHSQSFGFYKNNKLATTEDILSRMEGVNLVKRGAYGLEPALRNYTSGQTNLTIDGMRIYGACTDKMDPVSIYVEPANLSSIQIAHGASGALNGSTIGGQINMQLKEPAFSCHSGLQGQLSQTYLSVNNAYYVSGSFQQSMKNIAYRINGTYRKAGDYMAGSNLKIPYSGFEKYNIGASMLFKINSLQTLKVDYLGDWGRNIGYPALLMDVGSANAQIYSITHRFQFKKNKFIATNEFKGYYNEIAHQMDDTHRDDVLMHMDMPGWTRTSGFYNELCGGDKLKVRIDFHNVYSRADMIMYPIGEPLMYMQTLPENNLSNAGFSIKYKIDLKYKQQLTVNGRIDYFDQFAKRGPGYKQWKVFNTDISENLINVLKNGNITYSKQFNEKYLMQLNLGYGERIPTSNERYGYYLFNRQDQYDYVGNNFLKPEQSYQAELIFKHSFKQFEYSANFFYHHIHDYIYSYRLEGLSQMTMGANGLKTYRNINYAVSTGFEFNFKTRFFNDFYYIGNAKYVYAETYQKQSLPLIPPFKLQQALRYTYQLFQFQFEYDYAMSQNHINLDYGDKPTPEFHLFNLRASKNFRLKSTILQISLACENIFDRKYREHLDIGQIPRFGRNFSFNLNFLF